MKAEELIRELPKGLLAWYDFPKESSILYVSCGSAADDSLWEMLRERGALTEAADIHALETETDTTLRERANRYDYIIMAGALERSRDPEYVLRMVKAMLKPEGKLLLGTDNRLGIRYFCGDRDAYTGRNFDGIENYARIDRTDKVDLGGRAYARAEFTQMLENAGFRHHRFYSVLPVLERPQALYAEDYLPEEALEVRIFPQYHYPDTVFLEEERLYDTLIRNGLFHAMANGYLIECPTDECFSNVKQVTVSMERGMKDAMFTIIRRDDKVEKRPVYEQGKDKLGSLLQNTAYLQRHGVHMVDLQQEGAAVIMPYVTGRAATDYFRELLCKDKDLFLAQLDRFWEILLHSSEHAVYEDIDWERFEPGWEKRKEDDPEKDKWRKIAYGTAEERENLGPILKRGYVDLVSLNCFYADEEFVFFDQEMYVENLPAKVILQRTVNFIYRGNTLLESLLPKSELEARYKLGEYKNLWDQFTRHFLDKLRNDRTLSVYDKKYRRDDMILHSNRQRINYSVGEYERLFRDIFRGTENRQLYLFGSGYFAKIFLSRFGEWHKVEGIVDNDPHKWGTRLGDIPVYSPEHLKTLPVGSYKVIVCVKNYVPVIKQIEELGITNYGIFDSNLNYERQDMSAAGRQRGAAEKPAENKKYHIGYIAGVFDLFHIGHLNLLRRAKEQCDYLIVGVVNDESVMKNKKTMPFISFSERIELVRACRYVDEAVEIPTDYNNTDEAYRRYHFDVQFSGSDYAEDPDWLAKKAWLQKQGADLVFFPYTQSTSSTKIKAAIRTKNPDMTGEEHD